MSTAFGELTSGMLSDFEYKSRRFCGCGPWRWYKGVGEIHMNFPHTSVPSPGTTLKG
jgi:hypothetical protein